MLLYHSTCAKQLLATSVRFFLRASLFPPLVYRGSEYHTAVTSISDDLTVISTLCCHYYNTSMISTKQCRPDEAHRPQYTRGNQSINRSIVFLYNSSWRWFGIALYGSHLARRSHMGSGDNRCVFFSEKFGIFFAHRFFPALVGIPLRVARQHWGLRSVAPCSEWVDRTTCASAKWTDHTALTNWCMIRVTC